MSEQEEKVTKDWKAEKEEWEKTIKCPHCTHQLRRKKLKKHIANIHPALFVENKNSTLNGPTGFPSEPSTGGNRTLLSGRPRGMPMPSQPKIPIPNYIREQITQSAQSNDPWKTKCDFCPYNGNGLSRHMLTHTEEGKKMLKEERDEIVSCPHCSHVCKKKAIRKHIKAMHPHVVGDDTQFNYPLRGPGDSQQASSWGNYPIPEVTVSLDSQARQSPYKNLYGSFTSGQIYQNSPDTPIINTNRNDYGSYPTGETPAPNNNRNMHDYGAYPSGETPAPNRNMHDYGAYPSGETPAPNTNKGMNDYGSFTSGDIFNKPLPPSNPGNSFRNSSDSPAILPTPNSNRSMNNFGSFTPGNPPAPNNRSMNNFGSFNSGETPAPNTNRSMNNFGPFPSGEPAAPNTNRNVNTYGSGETPAPKPNRSLNDLGSAPPGETPLSKPNRSVTNTYGSFTSGDIFNKPSLPTNIPNPNRNMNTNYNQKPNSFRPPIPGEEDNNQGGGAFSERNGTFKRNHEGGYQENYHGGYQDKHQGGYSENHQGGYPESHQGGYPEKNGHSGNYDEYYSGYGSHNSGGNTSSAPYNEGQPHVGPDYGYGYARNSAPWDSATTSNNHYQAQQGGERGYQGGEGGYHGGEGSYGWSQGW